MTFSISKEKIDQLAKYGILRLQKMLKNASPKDCVMIENTIAWYSALKDFDPASDQLPEGRQVPGLQNILIEYGSELMQIGNKEACLKVMREAYELSHHKSAKESLIDALLYVGCELAKSEGAELGSTKLFLEAFDLSLKSLKVKDVLFLNIKAKYLLLQKEGEDQISDLSSLVGDHDLFLDDIL